MGLSWAVVQGGEAAYAHTPDNSSASADSWERVDDGEGTEAYPCAGDRVGAFSVDFLAEERSK
ncbi:MAG: hypothetical protein ABIZ80_12085, partial [Bryobacteraceae bacterium]